MTSLLEWALKAQARGLHIFPVTPGDKTPHHAAGYRDHNGTYHGWGECASNRMETVLDFWSSCDPRANIGIACKPSELLVIDLDIPKEPWKLRGTEWEYLHSGYGPIVTGADLWDEMIHKLGGGEVPLTYTVRTGSGGEHLYYQWPAHWPKISQASPVKGVIDVRGNGGQWGGYVLAEGSVTAAGAYEMVGTGKGPQLAPEWIRQLVAEKPHISKLRPVQGIRQPGAVSWSGLVESVRSAGEGNRNNALLWAARAMCSDGAPVSECMDTLGPAAESAGLGHMEIERTIESAYRVQRQKEGL